MIPLQRLRVSSPCTQDWSAMDGDARERFCASCCHSVHDLSALTRQEAQDLLDRAPERLCVRFQTRPDGTPLTRDDEPASAPRWPQRMALALSGALALLLAGGGGAARGAVRPAKPTVTAHHPNALPGQRVPRKVSPGTSPRLLHTMGRPAMPPPPVMGMIVSTDAPSPAQK